MTLYYEKNGVFLVFFTVKNVDIPKYLELGLYEKVWLKENSGISPSVTGMWLGISKPDREVGVLSCTHAYR